jgi:hypothetical protein
MKKYFILLLLCCVNLCSGQAGFVLDSLPAGKTKFTQNYIYSFSDKLVKFDYSGNIMWSKSLSGYSYLEVEDEQLYVTGINQITKLDSSGNILWAKDFSVPLCPSLNDSNVIIKSIINGNRIYLLIDKWAPQTMGYPYFAIVTLDTTGNLINTWCADNGHYDTFNFLDGIKSPSGGAWIVIRDGGNYHPAFTFKIDTNGNPEPSTPGHQYSNGEYNLPFSMFIQSDSSHCMVLNSFGQMPTPTSGLHIVTESDDGSSSMNNGFKLAPATSYLTWNISGIRDPQDNIYITASGYTERYILKTDRFGNILKEKKWPDALLQAYQLDIFNPYFRNDTLYIAASINGKAAIIKMDSLLNTTCYPPQNSSDFVPETLYVNAFTPDTALPVTYIPQNINLTNTSVTPPVVYPACAQVAIDENISKNLIVPFPNPAETIISFPVPASGKNNTIKIFTAIGELIYMSATDNVKVENMIVDVSFLSPGIYFFTVNQHQGKFIKM